jgi:hypothetical protein
MPGDSKPISDAALSRLTAYVEIECEGSDDEFIEGNDVRVNFADLKGLLARLRSAEMERDEATGAWEQQIELLVHERDTAQAKLSEVEGEAARYRKALELIASRSVLPMEHWAPDTDISNWAIHLAKEAIDPSSGKDSSGEDRGEGGEG